MTYCRYCGEELLFRYIDGRSTPIHVHGGWCLGQSSSSVRTDSPQYPPRYTAYFVNPNATCPVCGDPVFYYQNEYGSRVFFDELGPPWPKHPCTDNDNYRKAVYDENKPLDPRSIPRIRSVQDSSAKLDGLRAAFMENLGLKPWIVFKVTDLQTVEDTPRICVEGIPPLSWGELIFTPTAPPCLPEIGSAVFLQDGVISFFNIKQMSPVQYAVTVQRTPSSRGDKRRPRRQKNNMKRRKKKR